MFKASLMHLEESTANPPMLDHQELAHSTYATSNALESTCRHRMLHTGASHIEPSRQCLRSSEACSRQYNKQYNKQYNMQYNI